MSKAILFTLAIVALCYVSYISVHKQAPTTFTQSAWSSEIQDWNGGKIIKVGYADPILGVQYHLVPYVPAQLEP